MLLRTHSNGHRKGNKYLFFIKVGAANVFLKLNYLQRRVDTIQQDHISHTKQYQTFYRKMTCNLLNFRGVKNG